MLHVAPLQTRLSSVPARPLGYPFFFFLMIRRPPRSTLFPYTSSSDLERGGPHAEPRPVPDDGGLVWHDGESHVGQERRSEEHTSELQSRLHLVCRLLLEKKKTTSHAWRRESSRPFASTSQGPPRTPQR